jgi:hypothetical protein
MTTLDEIDPAVNSIMEVAANNYTCFGSCLPLKAVIEALGIVSRKREALMADLDLLEQCHQKSLERVRVLEKGIRALQMVEDAGYVSGGRTFERSLDALYALLP